MELLMPIGSGDTLRNYWMKELQRQDQTWRLPGERQGMVGWEAWVEVQLTGGSQVSITSSPLQSSITGWGVLTGLSFPLKTALKGLG